MDGVRCQKRQVKKSSLPEIDQKCKKTQVWEGLIKVCNYGHSTVRINETSIMKWKV